MPHTSHLKACSALYFSTVGIVQLAPQFLKTFSPTPPLIPLSPHPWQPVICFLSLSSCLWTFHGTDSALCVGFKLISISTLGACSNASLLATARYHSPANHTPLLSRQQLRDTWMDAPLSTIMDCAAVNTCRYALV